MKKFWKTALPALLLLAAALALTGCGHYPGGYGHGYYNGQGSVNSRYNGCGHPGHIPQGYSNY